MDLDVTISAVFVSSLCQLAPLPFLPFAPFPSLRGCPIFLRVISVVLCWFAGMMFILPGGNQPLKCLCSHLCPSSCLAFSLLYCFCWSGNPMLEATPMFSLKNTFKFNSEKSSEDTECSVCGIFIPCL